MKYLNKDEYKVLLCYIFLLMFLIVVVVEREQKLINNCNLYMGELRWIYSRLTLKHAIYWNLPYAGNPLEL